MSKSESAHARNLPSGLKARVCTWSAWLFSRTTGSACGGRHTRADVSHPAETSRPPSGLQAKAGMRSVWLFSSAILRWVNSSHTRTTRSSPAVAMKSPRGANAIADTGPGCASTCPRNRCVTASQNRTEPSSWPLASVRPSGLNATAVTHDGWARRLTSCPLATSHSSRSSLPLASSLAPGLKHQSVSRSLRKCRASSLPSAAHCRRMPASSIDQSDPSAAKATPAMSPSVWKRGSPNTRWTSGEGRGAAVSSGVWTGLAMTKPFVRQGLGAGRRTPAVHSLEQAFGRCEKNSPPGRKIRYGTNNWSGLNLGQSEQ